jgi:hypothetical protein
MVVETMRALADGSVSEGSTGEILPDRVREVIAGRLGAARPSAAGALLAVAAVIGREFDFALLQAASSLEEAAAAEEIEGLVRTTLLSCCWRAVRLRPRSGSRRWPMASSCRLDGCSCMRP